MAQKMWAGRTAGETDKLADDFNSSIHFDCRMYKQDIKGSMAHAAMLGAKGIITQAEAETLIAGLEEILADIESGALDINMKSARKKAPSLLWAIMTATGIPFSLAAPSPGRCILLPASTSSAGA